MAKRLLARKRVRGYLKYEVLTIPNAITLIRTLCALAIIVWPDKLLLVFCLAFIGAISDIIDGFIAKHFGLGTRFGKRFDQYTDWFFGAALIFAIFWAEGLSFYSWPYNAELLLLVGGYLLWRLKYPRVETTFSARIKTGMQFAAGPLILAGHAHIPELFLMEDGYDRFLITLGYQLVWASVGIMFFAGWEYRKQ